MLILQCQFYSCAPYLQKGTLLEIMAYSRQIKVLTLKKVKLTDVLCYVTKADKDDKAIRMYRVVYFLTAVWNEGYNPRHTCLQ